ncbi:MAG: hypothetical protein E7284_06270 [Lachnospiraceae bacterium]|nr:hypothetical protein [Lachnospiraceae bacterium]
MDRMDMIIAQLKEKGYDAVAHDVIKNGVTKHGISIREDRIAPCIYLDDLLAKAPDVELDDLVTQIINIYENRKNIDIDLDEILSKDYILSHLYIALQRSSDEPLIKRDCELEGIEEYLLIKGQSVEQGSWSIKLNQGILDRAELSLDEAWAAGEANTFAPNATVIKSMLDVMNDMFDCDFEEELGNPAIPMYVISNRTNTQGAVQVLDKKAVTEFARKHNASKLIILPSSTHEMIIVIPADDEELDLSQFESMVTEVNATQVTPEERLTNRAYILHIDEV